MLMEMYFETKKDIKKSKVSENNIRHIVTNGSVIAIFYKQ